MTASELRLEDILTVEDSAVFGELEYSGVLVWPAIRNVALRMLVSDLLYRSGSLASLESSFPWHIARTIGRAVARSAARPAEPSRVMIHASGLGLLPIHGQAFNPYTDYFAGALERDTWLFETSPGRQLAELARSNRRLSFTPHHQLIASACGRMLAGRRHRALAELVVDTFARRAADSLGWALDAARRSGLVEKCARRIAAYPARRRLFARLLRRVEPRVLLLEQACYGEMAVFNATARELGVTVAEYQHGMISSGHMAYNVAPSLERSAAYQRTQPHVYLGYSEYGNTTFNAPVERVAVGNPHREMIIDGLPDGPRTRVLVLGDGHDTEKYLELCVALSRGLPADTPLVFRPHPLERERTRALIGSDQTFAIDVGPDIYQSLATASAVIAEHSSALFEAVGVSERVLVWDTPKSRFVLGDHPFSRFSGAGELVAKLADGISGVLDADLSASMWATGWRARYRRFVDSV